MKGASQNIHLVEEGMVRSQARPQLSYFEVGKRNLQGILKEIPSRDQIPLPINESLVVEYYAKYI